MSSDRTRHIRARLADGFTVEQLCRAIDRVAADPFSLGANDRRTPYIEPKTILRSPSKVDEWLAIVAAPAPSRTRGPTGLEDTEQW
jgi:uncharacterized phage protein (TIGR02220 family)